MVSIVIPCYNNGIYLVKMIDCFRHQTSSDWEMIIVDDGSTDDTPKLVKNAIRDLTNVFFYKRNRQPKGSVVCRNIGFKNAKGKYICHLDADDLVSSTFVEHRISFMESHPEVDYAIFPAKAFIDENNLPDFSTEARTWGVGDENIDLLARFLSADYPFSVWNNIYRSEKIKNILWDERVQIYTDFSFIIPCILSGLKHSFSGLNEVDYYYRITPGNKVAMTSNLVSQIKCDSTLYLFTKTIESLKEHNIFDKYKDYFFDFIVLQYQRLLMGSTKENVDKYISFIKNYYGHSCRFKMTRNLVGLKSGRAKTLIVDYIVGIVFGRKDFVKTANYLLIHRLKKVLTGKD